MTIKRLCARVIVVSSGFVFLALLIAWSSNGRAQSGLESKSTSAEPAKPEDAGLKAALNRTRLALAGAAERVRAPETPPSETSGQSLRSGLPEALGSRTMMAGPPGAPAMPVVAGAPHSKLDGRRDPFRLPSPPAAGTDGMGLRRAPLPGKRGLIIAQLRLQGIVRQQSPVGTDRPEGAGPSGGAIAVVTNSTGIAYFLRENDELYDGRVARIGASSVDFEEHYLDSDGRITTRVVVRPLSAVPDEVR